MGVVAALEYRSPRVYCVPEQRAGFPAGAHLLLLVQKYLLTGTKVQILTPASRAAAAVFCGSGCRVRQLLGRDLRALLRDTLDRRLPRRRVCAAVGCARHFCDQAARQGTHFTCFTSTKVQILTHELRAKSATLDALSGYITLLALLVQNYKY